MDSKLDSSLQSDRAAGIERSLGYSGLCTGGPASRSRSGSPLAPGPWKPPPSQSQHRTPWEAVMGGEGAGSGRQDGHLNDLGKPQQGGGPVPCRPVKGWTRVLLTKDGGRSEPNPRKQVPFQARGQLWSSCPGQSKGDAWSRWCQAEKDKPALPFTQDRGLSLLQPLGSSPESRGLKGLLSSSYCSRETLPTEQAGPSVEQRPQPVSQPFQRAPGRGQLLLKHLEALESGLVRGALMTSAHLNLKGGNKEPPLPSSQGRAGEAPSEATDSGKTRRSSPRFTAGETLLKTARTPQP